jgi:N-acetyl-alpha-D-glucosaminyl L-malate synthase BshA
MVEVASFWKLDILHVHYAIPHAVCAYLAKKILGEKSPKIVTTLHGTDITLVGSNKSFYPTVKFSIEQSDGVTAVSTYLMKKTKEDFQIKKEIEVIYNFIDTGKFKPETEPKSSLYLKQRKRYAPNNEKVLMHISNFRPVKRVDDVIKTFNLIQKEIPAVLVLIGEGPDLSKALELSKSLGLKEKVFFLGNQSHVENLLPLSDLFLLPSHFESFGLVALEALSCGVPVIGIKTGGLPEVVDDGKCGFLAELGDYNWMAQRGLEILKNEDKLKDFKINARKKAVENFDSQLIIPQYEEYYNNILGEGR